VSEVFASIVAELNLLCRSVTRADEDVVVFDEHGPLAVGRMVRVLARAWASAWPSLRVRFAVLIRLARGWSRRRGAGFGTFVGGQVAAPGPVADAETNRL